MEKEILLDCVLVPAGFMIMVVYHIWLLYQVVYYPSTTVIGTNAIIRQLWVRAMMKDTSKNGVLAVQTLRNNIMASTLLASTAIMLSSLIAVLMAGGFHGQRMGLVYGDRSNLGLSIKFFSILACFLVAFLLIVQSIRYYSHASILINVPYSYMEKHHHYHHHESSIDENEGRNGESWVSCSSAAYVGRTVNRGGYFWSFGLRAFYFSFPLFLWLFGPIPMFLSSIILVFLLYFLDLSFLTISSHPDETTTTTTV